MQKTGKSRRDGVIAATAALAVNGWIAWMLPALLVPRTSAVDDDAPLQVVWVAAAPRPLRVIAPLGRHATKAPAPRVTDPPHADAPHAAVAPELPAPVTPARPMSAVYLQQARQWAQEHPAATAPVDPFANRPVALTHQAASRFRLSREVTVADAVAMVGVAFGGAGYTTDDCRLIRGRIVGLVVAGDEQAVQQDLDYQRRYCRP